MNASTSVTGLLLVVGMLAAGCSSLPTSPSRAQQACSQSKTEVLSRLAAAESACVEKAEKEGRADDAKRCRTAPAPAFDLTFDENLRRVPDPECPPANPVEAAARVDCVSGVLGGGVGWAICCARTVCCWAMTTGEHGCASAL